MANYEIGKVYDETAKSGNPVKRKCIGLIDEKFQKEQDEVRKKNGFAPVFVKDGAVFLGLTPPTRNKLSEAEKKKREEAKEAKSKAYRDRVAKNKAKRLAEKKAKAEKKKREAEKVLAELGE